MASMDFEGSETESLLSAMAAQPTSKHGHESPLAPMHVLPLSARQAVAAQSFETADEEFQQELPSIRRIRTTPTLPDFPPIYRRDGVLNNVFVNRNWWAWFQDPFHGAMQSSWASIFMYIFLLEMSVFLFFGLWYWAISDDCLAGLGGSFREAFYLSVITQQGISGGDVAVHSDCTVGVFLVTGQSVVGTIVSSLILGIIFARFSRASSRAPTLMIANQICIGTRNGERLLMVRVADTRRRSVIHGATPRIYLTRCLQLSDEGEGYMDTWNCEVNELTPETGSIFLGLPMVVTHTINEKSPLWQVDSERFKAENMQIIVILEGTDRNAGTLAAVQMSYVGTSVVWNAHYANIITIDPDLGLWHVDYGRFHSTERELVQIGQRFF